MARNVCCWSAAEVGGMFSSCLFPFVNKFCLASSTLLSTLVLSYRRTTNLSRILIIVSGKGWVADGSIIIKKASVTSGYTAHMFHTLTLPFPQKKDTQSQPVKAWKAGNALEHLGPSWAAMWCAGMYLYFDPTPKAIQSSLTSVLFTHDTARTRTSVSVVKLGPIYCQLNNIID